MGIGPVPEQWDAADFVLGKFGAHERKSVDEQTKRACEAVVTWVEQGTQAAMSKHNGSPPAENRPTEKKTEEKTRQIKSDERNSADEQ
jgi:PTH1 family peptidyl-tRNA hydrolase